jgi:ABC-type lipoprotein export system ATPase subunit
VRDETAGALDRENAAAYITMLRRAAQIIGASKVVFVSHDEETWALADSVLLVRDGRIVQARIVDGRVEPVSPTEAEEVVFEEREAA